MEKYVLLTPGEAPHFFNAENDEEAERFVEVATSNPDESKKVLYKLKRVCEWPAKIDSF